MSPPSEQSQSILIIGSTGRTGIQVMKQLFAHSSKPTVHAFCRDKSKLPSAYRNLCASIVEGDARSVSALETALITSEVDTVIVSVGNGDSVAKSDIRTASAVALAEALKNNPSLSQVRVLVVSSTGAGGSRIKVGMGIGKLIEHHLRHVLHDHAGQEAAFLEAGLADRTVIVRATALTDHQPTGKVVSFGDKDKSPTIKTDREDLAKWITEEVCGGVSSSCGKIVNVTGKK